VPAAGGTHVASMQRDDDDTIRTIRGLPQRPRVGSHVGLLAGLGLLLGALGAGFWFWQANTPAIMAPTAPVAPPPLASVQALPAAPVAQAVVAVPPSIQPQVAIDTATVEQIGLHETADVSVFRLQENPAILVLDFDSLAAQGRMLDRPAALLEKAGLPRDRILSVDELREAVRTGGDTPDGFYFGHDYSVASLAAFFNVADRDRVVLRPEEQMLRRLLSQEGWLVPGTRAGVISVPRAHPEGKVTPTIRSAILTHELSHGEYFTKPGYAEYVHRFWLASLTPREREGVRSFLAIQAYDVANEELLENEMQAYLMFTTDPRFFAPRRAGLTVERRGEIRALFLQGMPDGWLRDVLADSMRSDGDR
jgi:hypothetical protein